MKKVLCIYHGACDDGFAAAWCVRAALGDENVEFYPGVYNKAPPDVAGRDVVMVDFSYKKPVIDAMAATARSILILDHHATAADDLKGYAAAAPTCVEQSIADAAPNQPAVPVHVLFDMSRSGAGITWDYFNAVMPRPTFVDYVEDRDLWKRELRGSDEFTIALRSYPQDFEVWDGLFVNHANSHTRGSQDVSNLIAEGRSIQRYYRTIVESMKKEAQDAAFDVVVETDGDVVTKVDRAFGGIVNAPYAFASEVAGEIIDGRDFGACYFRRADGRWQYSLRSRSNFDVSKIALQYGGGGHRQAAGFDSANLVHLYVR